MNTSTGALIGERVKALRKRLGLTQKDVVARTGGAYAQPSLSDLENGKIENPSIETLRVLAKGFDMEPDAFLRYIGVLPAEGAEPAEPVQAAEREIVLDRIAALLTEYPDLARGLAQIAHLPPSAMYDILRTTVLLETLRRSHDTDTAKNNEEGNRKKHHGTIADNGTDVGYSGCV